MKRGNKLSLPHILPDDQMERMAKRGAEYIRSVGWGMQLSESDAYHRAYAVLEAAGLVAACKVNGTR